MSMDQFSRARVPVGPYDHRKRRSRCWQCSRRHIKCSGGNPCNSCKGRGIICEYADDLSARGQISIDAGRQYTTRTYDTREQFSQRRLGVDRMLQPTLQSFYIHNFQIFLCRNVFSGHDGVRVDVEKLVGQSGSGSYLMNAILCIGAMEAINQHAPTTISKTKSRHFAIQSYSDSINGLRQALSTQSISKHAIIVLWTTLLLGLFELMSDSTGQGWTQHMVHGTSKALVASGPRACQFGYGRRFFLEVKIFEVCRAIIFNQDTFLVNKEWMSLSSSMRTDMQDSSCRLMDELLDIIAQCAALRVRAAELVWSLEQPPTPYQFDTALDIAVEGNQLRDTLNHWKDIDIPPIVQSGSLPCGLSGLAQTLHSATSIYLSGIFDYELVHWQLLDVVVPTLLEDDIQIYATGIIRASEELLRNSAISPLLLLFPLRVAGARSWFKSQQDLIVRLLRRIEARFAVAAAFRQELLELWENRERGLNHISKQAVVVSGDASNY